MLKRLKSRSKTELIKQMFNNAETILGLYNDNYVSEIKKHLTELNKGNEE